MPEKVETAVYGIAPRSDTLLRTAGDAERGRLPETEAVRLREEETAAWLTEQAVLDLTYQEDGKLAWHDYLRPIVEQSDGFAPDVNAAPVTRWFDTNTFYRQPEIVGALCIKAEGLDDYFTNPDGKWQVSLLSPFSFAGLCAGEAGQERQRVVAITDLYSELLDYLADRGADQVLLHEPLVPFRESQPADLELAVASVNELAAGHPDLPLIVYGGYGDGAPLAVELSRLDRDIGIGVDCRATPAKALPPEGVTILVAGVVSGDNTYVEPEDELLHRLEQVADRVGAEMVVATHSTDLELVPAPYAYGKLQELSRLAVRWEGQSE